MFFFTSKKKSWLCVHIHDQLRWAPKIWILRSLLPMLLGRANLTDVNLILIIRDRRQKVVFSPLFTHVYLTCLVEDWVNRVSHIYFLGCKIFQPTKKKQMYISYDVHISSSWHRRFLTGDIRPITAKDICWKLCCANHEAHSSWSWNEKWEKNIKKISPSTSTS